MAAARFTPYRPAWSSWGLPLLAAAKTETLRPRKAMWSMARPMVRSCCWTYFCPVALRAAPQGGCARQWLFHGGGWQKGDKLELHVMAALLASRGIVAFPVEYRLVSGQRNRWPACFDDWRAGRAAILRPCPAIRGRSGADRRLRGFGGRASRGPAGDLRHARQGAPGASAGGAARFLAKHLRLQGMAMP